MLHRGLHVWSLKRYCVTVNDNWTPLRLFWTLDGAKKFYRQHRTCANVFKWREGEWQWMCGARDLQQGGRAYRDVGVASGGG